MIKSLILVSLYFPVTLLEVMYLRKLGDNKKIIFYLVLISGTFLISVLLAIGIKVPSPNDPIKAIVSAVEHMLKGGR